MVLADTHETLDATVERVVFRNPESGYSVLRVQAEGRPAGETVVGRFQELHVGERARFRGHWVVDAKHGRQFAADTSLPLAPSTLVGIEKYLGSGLVPGVGPVMARRIVDRFGLDTLEVLERDERALAKVSGIGQKRAVAIRAALKGAKAVRDVMVFLETAGVSPSFALRIHKRLGDDAIRRVQENPYCLAAEVAGIGFLTADQIAERLGVPKNSPARAEAGLLHTLEEAASEGHVYCETSPLLDRATALLDIDRLVLEQALDRLVLMGRARRHATDEGAAVYLPRLDRAEAGAARALARLLSRDGAKLPLAPAEAIRRTEEASGIKLGQEQRGAFAALGHAKIMLLTGGPGTGKTTLLRGLVSYLAASKLRVLLAAPTGRAARRMTESTGREASTLHRLLEYTPRKNRFERDHERPLEADAVVVDEVSMIDLELFAALLDALGPKARLLLVGDPDQLPSVGPGRVLDDLLSISCRSIPRLATVRLDQIFRQAAASLIVTGAHDILKGRAPRTGHKGDDADLFLIERDQPEEILAMLLELVGSRIPSRFGWDPIIDIQVLTPMHKGLLGSTNLNAELQALLNPGDGGIERSGQSFRRGDKVMQVRNNYDLEVFNGDVGKVTGIGQELDWLEVTFQERAVRYPANELDQLTLAYACSVHKSQGSEYPCVVIPLHTQHYVMLERNLLYTALTRGKRLVVLVGSKRAVDIAVRTAHQRTRASRLTARTTDALAAAAQGRE